MNHAGASFQNRVRPSEGWYYLAARVKAFDGFADEIRRLSASAETRAQMEQLKGTVESYQAAAGKTAAIRNELLEIAAVEASGLTVTDEVQARAGKPGGT